MISLKEYKEGEAGLLIAACDSELLGRTFSEGELKLDVKEDFYKGEEITEQEFADRLKRATIANLVGEKTVSKAIELGLVVESSVLYIKGIPHAQVVHGL